MYLPKTQRIALNDFYTVDWYDLFYDTNVHLVLYSEEASELMIAMENKEYFQVSENFILQNLEGREAAVLMNREGTLLQSAPNNSEKGSSFYLEEQ